MGQREVEVSSRGSAAVGREGRWGRRACSMQCLGQCMRVCG